MFTQFKNYVEQATMPICISAGAGALSGSVAGIAAVNAAMNHGVGIEECATNSNITLNAQMVGGLTGLAVGAVIGSVFPASHMLFDWYAARRQRILNSFQAAIQVAQDVELGAAIRP